MKRALARRLRLAAAGLVVLVVGLWAGAIAFDEPMPPPIVSGGGAIPGLAAWNPAEIPPVQRVTARDGAPLVYRAYPGRPERIVLLIHGSTGTSLDMHKVALALQAAGATAYALSLRGHGGSGRTSGDVSYIGQLDDDLADFMKALGLDKPGTNRTLIGYSAGGGFALRIASGRMRASFDDYIVISPFVTAFTEIRGRHIGPWANRASLRIVGLLGLERLGLPWFEDLTVVRYAVDPRPDGRHTPSYTYRMQRSLQADDWRRDLAHIESLTVILTSDEDDLTNAGRLGSIDNPHLKLRLIRGIEHDQMVADPKAVAEIVSIWQGLDAR
ncbi:MAG TPA: alpha/beta hydrolase [Reyranella sp.]|nr:alpha/beta hydrolase [Reyranella sp.]